jgi:hypothetical protein
MVFGKIKKVSCSQDCNKPLEFPVVVAELEMVLVLLVVNTEALEISRLVLN